MSSMREQQNCEHHHIVLASNTTMDHAAAHHDIKLFVNSGKQQGRAAAAASLLPSPAQVLDARNDTEDLLSEGGEDTDDDEELQHLFVNFRNSEAQSAQCSSSRKRLRSFGGEEEPQPRQTCTSLIFRGEERERVCSADSDDCRPPHAMRRMTSFWQVSSAEQDEDEDETGDEKEAEEEEDDFAAISPLTVVANFNFPLYNSNSVTLFKFPELRQDQEEDREF
jgi:hypothetical protein